MKIMPRKNSTTERLPYWDNQDGIVYNKKGQMEVGIEFFLPSSIFLDEGRQEQLWRGLNKVLRNAIPQGCRGRLYIHSGRATSAQMDGYLKHYQEGGKWLSENPVLHSFLEGNKSYHNKKRIQGQVKDIRFYFTCTVRPQHKFKPAKRRYSYSPRELELLKKEALKVRKLLRDMFTSIGIKAVEMDSQQVYEVVRKYFNPDLEGTVMPKQASRQQQAVYHETETLRKDSSLHVPTFCREVSGSEVVASQRKYIRVGHKYLLTMSFQYGPDSTKFGMIQEVLQALQGDNYYLVLDFLHHHRPKILSSLDDRARVLQGLTSETVGFMRNPTAQDQLDSTDNTIRYLKNSGDSVYRMGFSVILYADSEHGLDEMRDRCATAMAMITSGGNPIVGEVQNMRQYYELLCPFSGEEQRYTFNLVGYHATNMLPISGPWKGSEHGIIFSNRSGSITRIDPFDPRCKSWNGLVFGQMRSGKSVLMQSIILEVLSMGGDAIILDVGYSYERLVRRLGGQVIYIRPGEISVNIFDLSPGQIEPEAERKEFIRRVLRCMIGASDTDEKVEDAILMSAINDFYRSRRKEISPTESVYIGGRLSDFAKRLTEMDKVNTKEMTPSEKEVARKISLRLQNWMGNTPNGKFFDRDTNINIDNRLVYFEASALEQFPDMAEVAILMLSNLIIQRIENPKRRSIPKIITFDEAWKFIKSPQTRETILYLSRTTGKWTAAMYVVSQQLMDFADLEGLIANTTLFFIGESESQAEVTQKLLGLSDQAIKEIAGITNRRGEYSEFLGWVKYENSKEGGLLRYHMPPEMYWIQTSNGKDIARLEKLIDERFQGDEAAAIRHLAQQV